MIESLSIAVHAFVSRLSMSFSVDETLLPRQVNLSTSFREAPSVQCSNFLTFRHKITLYGLRCR